MNKDGIITAEDSGIGIDADISPVLGVGSDDLGYLCSNQHGKINIWSRFKPMIWNDVSIHMYDDYVNNNDKSKWWQGNPSTKQCGLYIPYLAASYANTPSRLSTFFTDEMYWTLDAPEPNSVQPARALDFDGYNHYAINPIAFDNVPAIVPVSSGRRFQLDLEIATQGDTHNLGFKDICFKGDPLSNWYLGLIMRKTETRTYVVTSDTPIGSNGSMSIEFDADGDWLWGKWEIVPIITDKELNTVTGENSATYIISANCKPTEIKVLAPGELTYGMLNAYWIDVNNPRLVGYDGFVSNSDSREHTYRVRLNVGHVASGGEPGEMTDVMHIDLGVMTFPARNADGTPFLYNFSSSDMGGAYEPLDIGTTYISSHTYYTNVALGTPDEPITWQPIPEGSYVPVEEGSPKEE